LHPRTDGSRSSRTTQSDSCDHCLMEEKL
jgi:hypothetical protein